MMRYGGMEFGFMAFLSLFWIALLVVLVLLVVRAFSGHGPGGHRLGWPGGPGGHVGPGGFAQPMSPEEILDLRFARGEIDADTYQAHRALLEARRQA